MRHSLLNTQCIGRPKPQIKVPNPENFGWEKKEDVYKLKPDSAANMKKQKTIYDTIMRKCRCKSSQCRTARCACHKHENKCTSLCQCINCENTEHTKNNEQEPVEVDEEEEIETSDSETDEPEMEHVEIDDTDVDL